jgi:hypothetical protein
VQPPCETGGATSKAYRGAHARTHPLYRLGLPDQLVIGNSVFAENSFLARPLSTSTPARSRAARRVHQFHQHVVCARKWRISGCFVMVPVFGEPSGSFSAFDLQHHVACKQRRRTICARLSSKLQQAPNRSCMRGRVRSPAREWPSLAARCGAGEAWRWLWLCSIQIRPGRYGVWAAN